MIAKKSRQIIIAFTGGSTSGKTTLVDKLLEEFHDKRDYIAVIRLDQYIYPEYQRPQTMMQGRNIGNLDLKESIDWDSFFNEISSVYAPIVFIDGFITFADNRSNQLVDLIVDIEYNTFTDFDIALRRRVNKSRTYGGCSVPSNYIHNTWNNDLCRYCTYFHDIVWPEMIKHPEYRKPYNWSNDRVLTLSATSDARLNVMKTLNFLHPFTSSYLN